MLHVLLIILDRFLLANGGHLHLYNPTAHVVGQRLTMESDHSGIRSVWHNVSNSTLVKSLTVLEGVPDIDTEKAMSLLSCPWAYKYKARDRLMILTAVTSPWAGLVDGDGSINLWIRWSSQYSHTSHQWSGLWSGHSREETKNIIFWRKQGMTKETDGLFCFSFMIYVTWLMLINFVSTCTTDFDL